MPYSLDSKLGDLLVDPRVIDILNKYVPGASSNPMIGMAKGMTLRVILSLPTGTSGRPDQGIDREGPG